MEKKRNCNTKNTAKPKNLIFLTLGSEGQKEQNQENLHGEMLPCSVKWWAFIVLDTRRVVDKNSWRAFGMQSNATQFTRDFLYLRGHIIIWHKAFKLTTLP